MSLDALAAFLFIAGVAAYVQTITGFAFGLITMGGVGLTGLLSLPDAAPPSTSPVTSGAPSHPSVPTPPGR